MKQRSFLSPTTFGYPMFHQNCFVGDMEKSKKKNIYFEYNMWQFKKVMKFVKNNLEVLICETFLFIYHKFKLNENKHSCKKSR